MRQFQTTILNWLTDSISDRNGLAAYAELLKMPIVRPFSAPIPQNCFRQRLAFDPNWVEIVGRFWIRAGGIEGSGNLAVPGTFSSGLSDFAMCASANDHRQRLTTDDCNLNGPATKKR
jgi:hypothetical protein